MRPGVVINFLGKLLMIVGLTQLVPFVVGIYYHEVEGITFLVSSGLVLGTGKIMTVFFSDKLEIRQREGFAIVTLGWFIISAAGAIPFYFSGILIRPVDAFFESTSGFTTTGATVISSLEHLPHCILLWRSLSHWLGGMGIIVMSIAILPELAGNMQLFKAEVPGPVHDRIKPRIRDTAKALWWVYTTMTVFMMVILVSRGMSTFDALIHSFGTISTGGFSSRTLSVRAYNSFAIEGTVTLFMFLAGVNLVLIYQFLKGKWKLFFLEKELKVYFLLVFIAVTLVTLNLKTHVYRTWFTSFRYAVFQVVSIISTTGFATVDYDIWPPLSRAVLLVLMFIGGCAGSTAGGIKVIRVYALLRKGWQELVKLMRPHAVTSMKIGRRGISEEVSTSILGFFFLYILVFVLATLILTSFGIDLISSISAVAATLGNVGPGLGLLGPLQSYVPVPPPGKLLLSFCMILGRLEIYTVLICFLSGFWKK